MCLLLYIHKPDLKYLGVFLFKSFLNQLDFFLSLERYLSKNFSSQQTSSVFFAFLEPSSFLSHYHSEMTSLKLFGSNQKNFEYQSYPPHFSRGILAPWVDQESASVEDDGDCSEIMIIRMMITMMMMRIPDNDGLYLTHSKTMQCMNLKNV